MLFAGLKLFAQFGHYFDMEVGMRMSLAVWQPPPTEPSSRARPLQDHAFARLALPPQPHRGKEATNHLFHTALEGAHHHNCNNNYHSLRAVRPRGKHQPDNQKTLHSGNFFLQLLTPPTEETNGGPTG